MQGETLNVTDGAPGLIALVSRAVGLDAAATARFAQLDDGLIDVFVTTPFDCVASRRIAGEVSRDGAAVAADELLRALQLETPDIGAPRDPNWPGALPPRDGFEERDIVPVSVVRSLADEGRKLAREFSGPLGPPKSLLDQTVITADADAAGGTPVEIPMRMIFTCTSLGLIPGFSAPVDVPRHLRVSTSGRWVRVDAPFGTVYHSTSLSLFT